MRERRNSLKQVWANCMTSFSREKILELPELEFWNVLASSPYEKENLAESLICL